MTKIEKIIQEVSELTPQELAKLSDWFSVFHAEQWDRQLEADAKAGKLDRLSAAALIDHKAGRTTAF